MRYGLVMTNEPTWGTSGPSAPTGPDTRGNQTGVGDTGGVVAMPSLVGKQIDGRYTIRGKLGEGGMGAVYIAEETEIGRWVAIKILHPWLIRDAEHVRRFRQEAQAVARLRSEHIVSIHTFGTVDPSVTGLGGSLYISMEYLEGVSLADALADGRSFVSQEVLDIAQQCALALDHAHGHGIVHRDLKPANIMLMTQPDGRWFVKLLDFGIAKLEDSPTTQSGAWMGTPQYMAPEQLAGKGVTAAVDVYALALVVYEMLAGRPPFVADNPMSLIHAHAFELPPPITAFAPGRVTPQFEQAVLRGLAKSPTERPASAGAFAQSLIGATTGQPSPGGFVGSPAPGAVMGASSAPPRRARRGRTTAWVFAGIAIVGGLGAGGWIARGRLLNRTPADVVISSDEVVTADDQDPSIVIDPSSLSLEHLTEEQQALVLMSDDELSAEFDRWIEVYPPSARKQVRDQVRLSLAMMPEGEEGDRQRKMVLVQMIVGMRSAAKQTNFGDERSIEALEEAYLRSPGSLTRSQRQAALDRIRDSITHDENFEFFYRNALRAMVDQAAGKPMSAPRFVGATKRR